MIKRNLLILCMFAIPSSLLASSVLDWTNQKVFTVLGVVDASIMFDAHILLQEGAKEDTINILVNSPGGRVDTGLIYIQAMEQLRARGKTINCLSGVLAASMGFQILAHCDNVYALPNTLLLFHPVAIGGAGRMTAADLKYYHNEMVKVEKTMNINLQRKFRFDTAYFDYHYQRETLHQAEELARRTSAIKIVTDVRGIDSVLYRLKPIGRSFNLKSLQTGILYINPALFLQFILEGK